MRPCAVAITYPTWAELVPRVSEVIDRHRNICQVRVVGEGRATRCVSLSLIARPHLFDPLAQAEGMPIDLNEIERILHQRCIPMDVEHIDLDRPWRETSKTLYWRRTPTLELTDKDPIFGRVPLWFVGEDIGDLTSIYMSCLLNPDPETAARELSVWQDLADRIPVREAVHVLLAANRMGRVKTHLAPLIERGLNLSNGAYEQALEALKEAGLGDEHEPHRTLHEMRASHVYQTLLQKLNCGHTSAAKHDVTGNAFALTHHRPKTEASPDIDLGPAEPA